MIYAEKRKEDGGTHGYFTLRYLVWNGNILGTYGVHYKPWDHAFSVPYGASRDIHTPATEAQIAARKAYDDFHKLPDDEQNAHYDACTEPDYVGDVSPCVYWDNVPCCCDGSGLVETTTDDQRAFEIAAMMADVGRTGNYCPRCGKESACFPEEVYCVECATTDWKD